MKILIVTSKFYPVNSPRSFRATELAKEFARQGHQVTVLTPRSEPVHSDFEKEHGVIIKDLGKPSWKDVSLKGSGPVVMAKRLLKRSGALLLEYPSIELLGMVKRALRNESGYDLMISIAVPYPVHWGVAAVRTRQHPIAKVWVADCGDPYMGQENDSFKRLFYFKYVEKWFCRKADFLTVPTKGAVQGYYPEFHEKIRVIPQGFNFNEIKTEGAERVNTKPVFAYAGMFIPGRRDPRLFLEFLLGLGVDFQFDIYTTSTGIVAPHVARSNGKITIKEYIPRQELLTRLAKVDFVVNFDNVGSKQTPSKLIDYLIIKKPILSVKSDVLDEETIRQFLAGDYRNQYIIDNPDQYRIENVCRKFLELT